MTLASALWNLKKEKQIKLKVSRGKEIIKIKVDINEMENKKKRKLMKLKVGSLINSINLYWDYLKEREKLPIPWLRGVT